MSLSDRDYVHGSTYAPTRKSNYDPGYSKTFLNDADYKKYTSGKIEYVNPSKNPYVYKADKPQDRPIRGKVKSFFSHLLGRP